MAKTRLTNADREAIRDAIIAHKFTPIEAALLAEENALAVQARVKAYGDYLKVIEAAPKGAFAEDSDVTANIGGRRIRLRFGADYRTTARVFSAHLRDFMLNLPDTDGFAAKVVEWAERAETARTQRSDLRNKLIGTLNAFRTFEDLQKGWPEADAFITARWRKRPDYTANVPAVTIHELSEALDLPPELAEAA